MTTVQVHATLYWKLVFEYNNLDNNGSIVHSYDIETYTKSTRSAFVQSVSTTTISTLIHSGVSVENGGTYGPVSASVKRSFGQRHSLEEMLQKTTRHSGEDVTEVKTRVRREYTIGPKSKLSLDQQCLDGPGLKAAFEVFSTEPTRAGQEEDVVIEVVAKPLEYVQSLEVVYTGSASNAPHDSLREIHGLNADINAGFGGDYVWLVPRYTRATPHAATSFNFVRQGDHNGRDRDLAKGAGGDYRYLIPVPNARVRGKIVECALLRSDEHTPLAAVKKLGWTGMSIDINQGRRGDYLYLLWKNEFAQ